jgi:hypothetical protein
MLSRHLMSSSPCSCAQTKRTVESSAPYVALGLLYAYLLYLSWTPDTLRAMFASKYWLPEVLLLPLICTLQLSECSAAHRNGTIPSLMHFAVAGHRQDVRERDTVASAWIHLLAVDLFAARSGTTED